MRDCWMLEDIKSLPDATGVIVLPDNFVTTFLQNNISFLRNKIIVYK